MIDRFILVALFVFSYIASAEENEEIHSIVGFEEVDPETISPVEGVYDDDVETSVAQKKPSGKKSIPLEEMTPKQVWEGWSLSLEGGAHFKTLPGVDFSEVGKGDWGHDNRFWGELGPFGGIGGKYSLIFAKMGYFSVKAMWTLFYPDIRWEGNESKITLSSIPLIGKYLSLGEAPGYYTFLIPMIYFDLGCALNKHIVLSLGSAYLWGLSPNILFTLAKHWSFEARTTIFLDRLIFDQGYHNVLFGIGVNYKF